MQKSGRRKSVRCSSRLALSLLPFRSPFPPPTTSPLSPQLRRSMDEREFKRLLNLFPVVRSRSYCQAEATSSGGNLSSIAEETITRDVENVGKNIAEDTFWQKLKTTAEETVGPNKAEQFLKAFRDAHENLVYKELSIDAAQSFINSARK